MYDFMRRSGFIANRIKKCVKSMPPQLSGLEGWIVGCCFSLLIFFNPCDIKARNKRIGNRAVTVKSCNKGASKDRLLLVLTSH